MIDDTLNARAAALAKMALGGKDVGAEAWWAARRVAASAILAAGRMYPASYIETGLWKALSRIGMVLVQRKVIDDLLVAATAYGIVNEHQMDSVKLRHLKQCFAALERENVLNRMPKVPPGDGVTLDEAVAANESKPDV